jgi:hypothetical protein
VLSVNRVPVVAALTALWGVACLATLAASCGGSPNVQCQNAACSTGTHQPYRVCAQANGDVSYSFGGLSCTCSASNSSQCQTCDAQVASFCLGDGPGTGGSGGTGGTNPGTGGTTTVACTASFSGATSGSFSPCAVTITYLPSQNQWSANTAGGTIAGTAYTWTGMSFVWSGQASTGTFDQNQSVGATNQVTQPGNNNPPMWLAAHGNGYIFGSAALTIESLGPSIQVSGQTLYQSPHGSWVGTLIDQNPETSLPEVMQTISF